MTYLRMGIYMTLAVIGLVGGLLTAVYVIYLAWSPLLWLVVVLLILPAGFALYFWAAEFAVTGKRH